MNRITVRNFLEQAGDFIRPKTEQEKRNRATYAMILITIASAILVYRLLP